MSPKMYKYFQNGAFWNMQKLGWFRASENLVIVHASPSQSTFII